MACRLCREWGDKKLPDTHKEIITCSCGQDWRQKGKGRLEMVGNHSWQNALPKHFQATSFR